MVITSQREQTLFLKSQITHTGIHFKIHSQLSFLLRKSQTTEYQPILSKQIAEIS